MFIETNPKVLWMSLFHFICEGIVFLSIIASGIVYFHIQVGVLQTKFSVSKPTKNAWNYKDYWDNKLLNVASGGPIYHFDF